MSEFGEIFDISVIRDKYHERAQGVVLSNGSLRVARTASYQRAVRATREENRFTGDVTRYAGVLFMTLYGHVLCKQNFVQ